jgi:hypothetical protein
VDGNAIADFYAIPNPRLREWRLGSSNEPVVARNFKMQGSHVALEMSDTLHTA